MQHNQLSKLTVDQEDVARKLIAADIVQWMEGEGWFVCDNGSAQWYRKVALMRQEDLPFDGTKAKRVAEVCQGIMIGDKCDEYLNLPDQYEGLSEQLTEDTLDYLGDTHGDDLTAKRWRIGFYLQTAVVDHTTIVDQNMAVPNVRVFDPYDDKDEALEIMHVTTDETEGWHKTFEGSHHLLLRSAVMTANLYLRTGERVLMDSDKAIAEVPLKIHSQRVAKPGLYEQAKVAGTVTELGYFGPRRPGEKEP